MYKLIFLLLSLPYFILSEPKEGRDYIAIPEGLIKLEGVTEIFWYGCPACFAYEEILQKISEEKGYSLVCVNKNGNNAFFVRKDYINQLIYARSVKECFRMSMFREYFDGNDKKKIDDELIFNYLIESRKFVEV